MYRLQGERLYLAVLERKDCRRLFEDDEYDFDNPTDRLHIGGSAEKADEWFTEIQAAQGRQNIRLGIFLNHGTVVGEIALQGIDWHSRSCSIGMGFAKLENRNRGYGKEAATLLLDYGFNNVGLERVSARTSEQNIGAQRSLIRLGFTQEGCERKALYLGGKRYDMLCYGLLAEEFGQANH